MHLFLLPIYGVGFDILCRFTKTWRNINTYHEIIVT